MTPRIALLAVILLLPAVVVTPSAAAAGPGADPPSTTDYRLRLGDKLRIEVHRDSQMSQSVQIRPDGKITLPLVGDIAAFDRTPSELRDDITRELTEYITRPVVTVIVVEATAPLAYVVGEVASPGAVTFQGETLTALQAIALAGGLKDFADRRHIRVLRPSILGHTVIEFDYRRAIDGRAPVYLQPGDTVVVPD
jgi:polysaccharide export outer membrane protein